MKCVYCNKEIKEEDPFYRINNEFYCDECCKEHTTTYYKIGDNQSYADEEVMEYDNLDEAIKKYKWDLEHCKKRLEKWKNSKEHYAESYIRDCEREKAATETMLKILENKED